MQHMGDDDVWCEGKNNSIGNDKHKEQQKKRKQKV